MPQGGVHPINLSTHSVGALYETFPAPEAHRLLQRLEFHYTPKHASWLNMVEIEIGVLRGQCLDRRIGERSRLEAEIAHWQRCSATIWMGGQRQSGWPFWRSRRCDDCRGATITQALFGERWFDCRGATIRMIP